MRPATPREREPPPSGRSDLYERKGAAALAEKARRILGERELPAAPAPPEAPSVELDNACVRAIGQLDAAVDREAWDEVEQLFAPDVSVESRRKIVGFAPGSIFRLANGHARQGAIIEIGHGAAPSRVVAVRGERLALTRLEVGTADASPGAPQDEMLQLFGLDDDGRIALQVWFDIEDIDAAIAELDAAHARFESEQPAGAATGKRGKPSGRALSGALRRPRLGRDGASCWPTTLRPTIVGGS